MSKSKDNQTLKFGQNITLEIFLFKNHAENETETSSKLL